jgi:hypothetical protein
MKNFGLMTEALERAYQSEFEKLFAVMIDDMILADLGVDHVEKFRAGLMLLSEAYEAVRQVIA